MNRSIPPRSEPPHPWSRLERLFAEARRLPEADREAFLRRACGDDPDLRAEASSLLAHADAGDALLSSIAAALAGGEPSTEVPTPSGAWSGRTLDHYRIEARVGSGGMGVVYRARDTRLKRPVALKFIRPSLSADATVKERILVEARAAAGIDHPNICTVHDVGEAEDGTLFIAMAYYDGETLKERLSGGPLPVQEAVDLVVQTAEGVRAAHRRGVLHQDIKPGNILVTPEGVAKLLDFGIASTGDGTLGDAHRVVGTAAYMAPERLRGEAVDVRSDIWSLGVVLYELLAGRRPFREDGPARMRHAILFEEPPPLLESRPDVPPALEAAVRRTLAKEPRERQQSAEELIAALRRAMADAGSGSVGVGEGPTAPGRRQRGRRAARAVVLTGVLTAVALFGSYLWSQVGDPEGPPSSEVRASATARALGLSSAFRPGRNGGAPDDAAYQAYLEGRYQLRRYQAGVGDREGLLEALAHFRVTATRSPTWAPGWAALGEALHWAATYGFETDTYFPEAKRALERALELDPDHARAHASLGYVLHRWDMDLEGSEARFRRALELDPDQYWHCGYAFFLLWTERYQEAIEAFRRAQAQDPVFHLIQAFLATSYRCAERLEETIVQAERVLAERPLWPNVRRDLVLALERTGRVDEAFARLDEATTQSSYWELLRALLHARAGRREEAEALLETLDEDAVTAQMLNMVGSRQVSPPPLFAAALVALGQPESAIQLLQAAVDRDPWALVYDRCYPELEALEGDPRYRELLRRTGLPDRQAAAADE